MKIFLLAIAMLIAIGVEIWRHSDGEPDMFLFEIPFEKLFALQRCIWGALFLLFAGAVLSGVRP